MTHHVSTSQVEGFDQLVDPERQAVIEHALACGDCRDALVAQDPSRLFVLLSLQPVPQEALDRLSARLDDAVGSPPQRVVQRRWLVAASIAAAVLLTVFVGDWLTDVDPAGELIASEIRAQPTLAASTPAVVEVDVLPARGIELISTPGEADVVNFALGETQVVMIFDAKLDI